METLIWVGLVTFFFSFLVQFLFYIWYRIHKDSLIEKNKSVVNYSSGIIGDGLCMPLVNIFAVLTLESIKTIVVNSWLIIACFIIGYLVTFLFHYGQAKNKLPNWTMPEVGKWNTLGLYHAFFMFFETSFLAFSLINYLLEYNFGSGWLFLNSPIIYSFLVLGIFFLTFVYDYRKTIFN